MNLLSTFAATLIVVPAVGVSAALLTFFGRLSRTGATPAATFRNVDLTYRTAGARRTVDAGRRGVRPRRVFAASTSDAA
jgi:hypothetical protein